MLGGEGEPDEPATEHIDDDRGQVEPDDSTLLIVEPDPDYARVLLNLARSSGFKAIVSSRGAEALKIARHFRPTAISLDLYLPDMLGWAVLSQLKMDPSLRHIPVQIVSLDKSERHSLARGAFSFVAKSAPSEFVAAALGRLKAYAEQRHRRLLVVEDHSADIAGISEFLRGNDIVLKTAADQTMALDQLRRQPMDCIVLDLRHPDVSKFALLAELDRDPRLSGIPVVVFTGSAASTEEESQVYAAANGVVVKVVRSLDRLLDETALFLHRSIADLPVDKQHSIERLYTSDEYLVGRTVLVVDDDARNIFALSSVLERRGMRVLTATNGIEAIKLVESASNLSIVLMDIMMPEMDGYQTIQIIRRHPQFRRTPIIALTAKAMKGDREKCLEAGASDYLAKPVNIDQLLSTLRTWLHR
jgi:CheY-like chemotaxis protein